MFIKSILVSILLVLYLSNMCDAIKCYVCQSAVDVACGTENFQPNKSFMKDCDMQIKPPKKQNAVATKCSLVVQKSGDLKYTFRDCLWRTKDENPECFKDDLNNVAECKSCDSDLCNSAPKAFGMIGATIFMCIVVLFLQ